jgi:hypothetical protein
VAADITLGGVFDAVAVAAPGGATVSVVDVAYLKRHLELAVPEAVVPLKWEEFGELFAGLDQGDRIKVAKLLLLRQGRVAATAPLEVHKAPGGLYRDRALSMLAVFNRLSLFILECLCSGDGRIGQGDMTGGEPVGGTSGSAAAMCVLGPLMMDAARRQLIGVPAPSGIGSGLPRAAPRGTFVSQLSDLAQKEESAAAAALAGDPTPRA